MNKADCDRARIAELRKLARIAQGRDVDQQEVARQERPQSRWEPDVGIPRFVKVGPGTPVLLMEEAARRLNWATAKVEAAVAVGELESVRIGWTTMVPLSEVERIGRTITGDRKPPAASEDRRLLAIVGSASTRPEDTHRQQGHAGERDHEPELVPREDGPS